MLTLVSASCSEKEPEHLKYEKFVDAYLQQAYKKERVIIENVPIYSDYVSPVKEAALRKYLLGHHLKEAQKNGLQAVMKDSELSLLIQEKLLVSIADKDYHYFYNVPKKYRYLAEHAARGLELLGERIQKTLKDYNQDAPVVKFAVSSAIRPVQYQNKLRYNNANASFISSHSYGISFDIFYDSFFVDLPSIAPPVKQGEPDRFGNMQEKMRLRVGYLMGASLRRQLRTVLAKTLLEMQNEGLIYAILERNQRSYHVTILKDPS